jgi:hypothetical protein
MCVSQRDELSLPQAARAIKQRRTKQGMEQCHKFEFCKLSVQGTFTFLYIDLGDDNASIVCPADSDRWSCCSAAETEASSVSDMASASGSASSESGMAGPPTMSNPQKKKEIMTSFFKPMAEILFLKNTDMEAILKAACHLQKWIDDGGAMTAEGIQEEDEADARIGDELEINFEETLFKQRAFVDHGAPHLMRNAADYSDRWFADGVWEFHVYYLCLAGPPNWPCNSAIKAMVWDRCVVDARMRWYCKLCNAKYRHKFGVLIEIINGTQASYCLAPLPFDDFQDAEMMIVEKSFTQFNTPAELLAALPAFRPFARGDLLQETAHEGHYHLNAEMMEGLATLEWSQLYNMTGAHLVQK